MDKSPYTYKVCIQDRAIANEQDVTSTYTINMGEFDRLNETMMLVAEILEGQGKDVQVFRSVDGKPFEPYVWYSAEYYGKK